MSAFVEEGGRKSITILMGFCLSFLFVVVFVLAYMFTADFVADHVPETGGFWAIWLPPVLISLAASLPCCCLMFLFRKKIVVPVAFAFFAVYYLVFFIALAAGYGGDSRGMLSQIVRLYMLPPVVVGNLLSWGSYLLFFRKRD